METKDTVERLEADNQKYAIHNFIQKISQRDTFDKLKGYINSSIKIRQGIEPWFEEVTPISINLDLTSACNYYCDHCIDLDILNKGHLLRHSQVKTIIDRWVSGGLRSVIIIGGGEPVLHPDFEEIVTFLKSKGLELGIASNGSRISKLAAIAPHMEGRDWIRLSLDAGTDETFQKIHNPKVKVGLDEILDDIRRLRNKFREYQMGFSFLVISDGHIANNKHLVSNIQEISLAAKRAKESGFSYFSLKPFISPSGYRPTRLRSQVVGEIREQIKRSKELEDGHFKVIESSNLLSLIKGFDKGLSLQPRTCHAQFFRLVVCPDGIYNCTLWRGFDMSHLVPMQDDIDDEFFMNFSSKLLERIKNFNASKECSRASCIYNSLNWFIEDIINNPEKVGSINPVDNFYDHFL